MSFQRAALSSAHCTVYARAALGALLLGAVGSALLGGCSSDDQRPALPAASAGSAGRGTQPGAAGAATEGGAESQEAGGAGGSPTQANGGAAPSAGAAGADHEGLPPGAGGDPGVPVQACSSDTASKPAGFKGVCSLDQGWATGAKVAVTSGDSPSFIAVTPSELTLLWSEPESSLPAYFLADRDTAAGAFAAVQKLPLTNVIAVSPDGLRLTVQLSNGSLSEATRATREEGFGEVEPGAYATLDSDAAAHHLMLGEVAISADDRSLYYTARSLNGDTPYPLRVSQRTGGEPWPVGTPLEACELEAYAEFGPHPTAISADGLTLFYFDGARGKARAAFRTSVDAAFSWFVDLPGLPGGQPNAACDRLYFSPTTDETSLLAAARQ